MWRLLLVCQAHLPVLDFGQVGPHILLPFRLAELFQAPGQWEISVDQAMEHRRRECGHTVMTHAT